MDTILCAIVELESGKYIAARTNTVVSFASEDSPEDQGIYKDRRYFYVTAEEGSKLSMADVGSDLEKLAAVNLEELHAKLDMSGKYSLSKIHDRANMLGKWSVERDYGDEDLPTLIKPEGHEHKTAGFRRHLGDFRRDYDID
ncbi:MAG: hypothetical protein HGA85_04260 [Nanoarchaeota archaeon]|nr:hypothetical protein [Nanoarchaeota archaeon]